MKSSNIKIKEGDIEDPFSKTNRNQHLVVQSMNGYVLMLNKFPVVKNHVEIVVIF